jgi:hypothetical protein
MDGTARGTTDVVIRPSLANRPGSQRRAANVYLRNQDEIWQNASWGLAIGSEVGIMHGLNHFRMPSAS